MKIGDIRIANTFIDFQSKKSNAKRYFVAQIHSGNRVRILGRPSLFARSWAYGETDRGERGFFDVRKTRAHFTPPKGAQTKGEVYERYLHDAYYANPDRKRDYIWAAQGNDPNHDGDPEWDCSGLIYAARHAAGIKAGRTNAEGYRKMGKRITKPSKVGDYGVILRPDGSAHHIVAWMSGGYVIEARGSAYGIQRNTIANLQGRNVVWYRDAKINAALKEAA
jgi:hypothetical protein